MSYDDAVFEAIREVLDTDLPDQLCDDAVVSRAALIAGMESDQGDARR